MIPESTLKIVECTKSFLYHVNPAVNFIYRDVHGDVKGIFPTGARAARKFTLQIQCRRTSFVKAF